MENNNSEATQEQPQENRGLEIFLRTLVSFFGVCFIAIGAGFLRESHLGLDPFTALNIGLSKHLGMSLGTVQLSFNIIIFIIVLILDRHQIGIGTLFNMALVGYGIEWFTAFYQSHVAESNYHIPIMAVNFALGLAFFTLGTSLYMEANLGVAPYDALAPIIVKHSKLKYQWVRATQDILFGIVAFLFGGSIGVATVIVAFFAGPIINLWNVHVSHGVMNGIYSFCGAKKKIKNVGAGIASASKNGLGFVRAAYRDTNLMQQNMSTFSDNQLLDAYNDTHNQIHSSQMMINNLQDRQDMLRRELQKRSHRR